MNIKTLKEYLGLPTIRVGGLDSVHPIASLGDTPPKGKGSRDSRATGLMANYTSQGVGTIKPMLTADAKAKQQKNWKEKGFGPYKFKKNVNEMEDFLNDLANNTPNADQFEDTKRVPRKK